MRKIFLVSIPGATSERRNPVQTVQTPKFTPVLFPHHPLNRGIRRTNANIEASDLPRYMPRKNTPLEVDAVSASRRPDLVGSCALAAVARSKHHHERAGLRKPAILNPAVD